MKNEKDSITSLTDIINSSYKESVIIAKIKNYYTENNTANNDEANMFSLLMQALNLGKIEVVEYLFEEKIYNICNHNNNVVQKECNKLLEFIFKNNEDSTINKAISLLKKNLEKSKININEFVKKFLDDNSEDKIYVSKKALELLGSAGCEFTYNKYKNLIFVSSYINLIKYMFENENSNIKFYTDPNQINILLNKASTIYYNHNLSKYLIQQGANAKESNEYEENYLDIILSSLKQQYNDKVETTSNVEFFQLIKLYISLGLKSSIKLEDNIFNYLLDGVTVDQKENPLHIIQVLKYLKPDFLPNIKVEGKFTNDLNAWDKYKLWNEIKNKQSEDGMLKNSNSKTIIYHPGKSNLQILAANILAENIKLMPEDAQSLYCENMGDAPLELVTICLMGGSFSIDNYGDN